MGAGEFVTQKTAKQRTTKINFDKTTTTESTILRCDDLRMNYGDHVLFNDLTFQIYNGDRFAITGPNGTGKSTLLKIMIDELKPTAGTITLAPKLNIGYYSQQPTHLNFERTIVEEIRSVRPEFSEQDARSFLGQFLFSGDDVFKTLGTLSGGEVSRVRLASLILSTPDILILDEPTNHLDIPSCEVLEEALIDYCGTIIVVSHDRYFLDRIAQKLLIIHPQTHALYAGNYSYYKQQLEQKRMDTQKKRVQPTKKSMRRKKSPSTIKPRTSPYDHLSIYVLEQMVMTLETKQSVLRERFGNPDICKNPEALVELQTEFDAVTAELIEVDAAWQDRADTH